MKKRLLITLMTFSASATAATDFSLLGADVSLSAFGTAAYSISDQPYNFERVINDDGTIARDTLAGIQIDAKLTEEFSATVQGKFAPSKEQENRWDPTLVWACLSWRPTNDWLFRVGKQRAPFYLFSESMDIGVTYDFAHLPTEMYSTAPNTDYIGGSFSKNWNIDGGELTLDGYLGRSDASLRIYQRDFLNVPQLPTVQGANYLNFNMDGIGTILSLNQDEDRYRVGFHYVDVSMKNGQKAMTNYSVMPASYFVPAMIAPAFTGMAYTVLPKDYSTELTSIAFTLGVEYHLPENFRLLGEYSHRIMVDSKTGLNTNGGYVSLFKEIDDWTPYISFAMLQSRSDILDSYEAANAYSGVSAKSIAAKIPAVQDAVKTINASQRVVADYLSAFDQHTIAIGSSYRLTPTQKIKVEWSRTRVGVTSSFVDAPSGGSVSHEDINVFSFSYNVVF